MAVVLAACLDRLLCRLGQRHASTGSKHTLTRHLIRFWPAAKRARRKFLQLLDRIGCRSGCRACHRMSRLAATRNAAPRKVLSGVTPRDLALFPRHSQELSDDAMDVDDGLGSEVSDSGLDVDMAIGLDDEQPVDPDCTTGVTAEAHTYAADSRAVPLSIARPTFLPAE